MAPVIDVSTDSPLAGVALRSFLFAIEDSVDVVRDRLLEVLNCYKVKIEQLKNSILEKNTALEAVLTFLLDMKKRK